MKQLLALLFLAAPLMAQTDYVYLNCEANTGRKVRVLNVNSGNYRELPESPYALEYSIYDHMGFFAHTLPIIDPGPYLYATRQEPDQIYGYRRLSDGHLEELPGFPITPYIPPGTAGIGFVWMVKHPRLPVLYICNAGRNSIGVYQIQQDGSLDEFPDSPFSIVHLALLPECLAFNPDGNIAFVNTFDEAGLLALKLDERGMFIDVVPAAPVGGEPGRGVVFSSDGRYLYATNRIGDQIFGFSVDGTELTPLPDFPIEIPLDTVWLAVQGSLLAAGGHDVMKVAVWNIAANGSLSLAPGSPADIHSIRMIYPAFNPTGTRISFGGSDYFWMFDLGADGRLSKLPIPIKRDGICWGTAMAPEITGDPHSLDFLTPPEPGDTALILRGQSNTPFYLNIDDQCLGPFTTDQDGFAEIPYQVGEDQNIYLRAYCDEALNIATAQTVPTLSELAFLMLVALLTIAGLVFAVRHRRVKTHF